MAIKMKMEKYWDIPDEFLTEIGRVIVRWNKLEGLMEFSLIELLGKSITEGRSLVVFTHMSFPQKMDVMGALIVECLTDPAYGWLCKYKTDVEPLLREAQKKRNTIAHSKWGIDDDGVTGKSNISARGALKMVSSQAFIPEIEDVSASIVKAADALSNLVFKRGRGSDTPQSGQ
ncbi:MAG: hypothetical protein WA826_16445 [Silvibacterium sp.]